MYLNLDVRQFRAILSFLPETAANTRSNTLKDLVMQMRLKITVKRATGNAKYVKYGPGIWQMFHVSICKNGHVERS